MGDKRVAIFQAEWPVQSQTINLATTLAEAGYKVELYLFKAWEYVELSNLWNHKNVHVYSIETEENGCTHSAHTKGLPPLKSQTKEYLSLMPPCVKTAYIRIRSFLQSIHAFSLLILKSEGGVLDSPVKHALESMKGKEYCCLIGVEKKGLIWAGKVAKQLNIPFVYYSLELYTNDFQQVFDKSIAFKRLRAIERKYHKAAFVTIIQDKERAEVLFRDNGLSLSKSTVFYIPVSVVGKPSRKKSWLLYELLDIPKHQKIILYFGQIGKTRYSLELAQAAQSFPDNWTLVMHGWGPSSEIEEIKAIDYRKKVVMSLEMVPSDRIIDVISSADVGLALYSSTISNDRLTHLSSEKMALYAQCGIPFIAFDYPGYRKMAEDGKWGVVIKTVEELPAAVAKILEAHGEYRRNANIAFERYYNFADNATKFIKAIGRF